MYKLKSELENRYEKASEKEDIIERQKNKIAEIQNESKQLQETYDIMKNEIDKSKELLLIIESEKQKLEKEV